MPSNQPVPSIADFVEAFGAGVRSRERERADAAYADTHTGSNLDHIAGPSALLFHRITLRQRDEFRSKYFDTAKGHALDDIVTERYPAIAPRVQDARGIGTAKLTRTNASAGAGTVWAGTRIVVNLGTGDPLMVYRVKASKAVGASDLTVEVEIEATEIGPEWAIDTGTTNVTVMRLEDPLWDTWAVGAVKCAPGTVREKDHVLRARVRQETRDARVGYEKRIREALADAGAAYAALFESDFLGSDFGLNRIFVSDANYQSPESLLKACRKALTSVGVFGTQIQVFGITTVALTFSIDLAMWESSFNKSALEDTARRAVLDYFATRENPFYWRDSKIRAAIWRVVRGIQAITITPSVPEPTLSALFDSVPLPRYIVNAPGVTVSVSGP